MDPSLFKFRPALFGLAVLCFFLPFVTLSCPGMSYSFSGIEVAFGATVEGQKLDGEPLAAIALLLAGVGTYLALKVTRGALKSAAAVGSLAVVFLLLVQSQVRSEAGQQGPVQISFQVGYWLAVIALGGGAALSLLALNAPQAAAGRRNNEEVTNPDNEVMRQQ